jgi:biopolymer transport protein ExbB
VIATLLGWAEAGGPIVIILAVLSVYSIALAVVKTAQFWGVFSGAAERDAALDAWRSGAAERARGMITRASPVNAALTSAMTGFIEKRDPDLVKEEAERVANAEMSRLSKNLRTLEILAVVSPLAGLLGTVLGMIESFQQLELAQGSANAAVLAGGIWQALLTTAAGLIVAIPAAVAAHLLFARLDRLGGVIEDAVTRLYHAERIRSG